MLTISMFTQIIYVETLWNRKLHNLRSQGFRYLYVVIHGYGVRWVAVEISGFRFYAFLRVWDFRVVACLPSMAHRTAVSQMLVPALFSGLSLLMKYTTA